MAKVIAALPPPRSTGIFPSSAPQPTSRRPTGDLPIIFLTAMTAVENEIRGLELGAAD